MDHGSPSTIKHRKQLHVSIKIHPNALDMKCTGYYEARTYHPIPIFAITVLTTDTVGLQTYLM